MKQKLKNFWYNVKLMMTLLVVEVIMFFICKGVIWIELVVRPYTKFGAGAMAFSQHIAFAIIGFFIAITICPNGGKRK